MQGASVKTRWQEGWFDGIVLNSVGCEAIVLHADGDIAEMHDEHIQIRTSVPRIIRADLLGLRARRNHSSQQILRDKYAIDLSHKFEIRRVGCLPSIADVSSLTGSLVRRRGHLNVWVEGTVVCIYPKKGRGVVEWDSGREDMCIVDILAVVPPPTRVPREAPRQSFEPRCGEAFQAEVPDLRDVVCDEHGEWGRDELVSVDPDNINTRHIGTRCRAAAPKRKREIIPKIR